jgi:hypothetical protein
MNATIRFILLSLVIAPLLGLAEEPKAEQPAPAVRSRSLITVGRVWLEGDSTLHRFRAEARAFAATVRVRQAEGDTASALTCLKEGRVQGFTLVVPVRELASGNPDLDSNLRKAMKSATHPLIVLKAVDCRAVATAEADRYTAKLRGTLRIAGVERPVEIDAETREDGNGMNVRGSKALLMSDFGITPPVLFLGMLRTDDRVVVHFDVTLDMGPETDVDLQAQGGGQ